MKEMIMNAKGNVTGYLTRKGSRYVYVDTRYKERPSKSFVSRKAFERWYLEAFDVFGMMHYLVKKKVRKIV